MYRWLEILLCYYLDVVTCVHADILVHVISLLTREKKAINKITFK